MRTRRHFSGVMVLKRGYKKGKSNVRSEGNCMGIQMYCKWRRHLGKRGGRGTFGAAALLFEEEGGGARVCYGKGRA